MPSSTDKLFNRILLVAVIIGAVVITAVTVYEDDRQRILEPLSYETRETLEPLDWGLALADKKFDMVKDNLFILGSKYELASGIYVLNLRVAGRYHSRVYTGMVRLIAEPYSKNLFMQVKQNKFKVIPYGSYAHQRLAMLFHGIRGERIELDNKHLDAINDTMSVGRAQTLVSKHSP